MEKPIAVQEGRRLKGVHHYTSGVRPLIGHLHCSEQVEIEVGKRNSGYDVGTSVRE